MHWWNLLVENESGLRAWHQVQARGPDEARKAEEARGLTVLSVETWGPNTRWVNLPNYERARPCQT